MLLLCGSIVVGVESVGFGVNVVWDIVDDSGFHFLRVLAALGGLSSLYLYFGVAALGRLNFSGSGWGTTGGEKRQEDALVHEHLL